MNRPVQIAVLFASVILLAGCATPPQKAWFKPGATQTEFSNDKYACLQQSQQERSGAYVNAYGGASTSGAVTNWTLYGACMNAHGWYLRTVQQ